MTVIGHSISLPPKAGHGGATPTTTTAQITKAPEGVWAETGEHTVRARGEMLCLTDMWKAAGGLASSDLDQRIR
jgi:hypothetical protein